MQEESYASDRELAKRFGNARPTIWRWIDSLGFPKPVKLSPGCTRWRMSEVIAWEQRQPRYTASSEPRPRRGA